MPRRTHLNDRRPAHWSADDKEMMTNAAPLVAQWEQRVFDKGMVAGLAKGMAQAVVTVMLVRDIYPSLKQIMHICACQDLAQLDQWLELAATAASVEEVLAPAAPKVPRHPRSAAPRRRP
jgi:hypothetical protein